MKNVLASAAVAAALAAMLAGCSSTSTGDATTAPKNTTSSSSAAAASAGDSAQRTVHYEVTSDGKTLGNVTYLTFNGGSSSTQQETQVAAPWSKDIAIKDEGLFTSSLFSLVAQADASATTITCKIVADGKTIQESTSSGPYAVATCSGSAK